MELSQHVMTVDRLESKRRPLDPPHISGPLIFLSDGEGDQDELLVPGTLVDWRNESCDICKRPALDESSDPLEWAPIRLSDLEVSEKTCLKCRIITNAIDNSCATTWRGECPARGSVVVSTRAGQYGLRDTLTLGLCLSQRDGNGHLGFCSWCGPKMWAFKSDSTEPPIRINREIYVNGGPSPTTSGRTDFPSSDESLFGYRPDPLPKTCPFGISSEITSDTRTERTYQLISS
ncbi:hypothetical protein V8F06_006207 [Rhypophila decipiens]